MDESTTQGNTVFMLLNFRFRSEFQLLPLPAIAFVCERMYVCVQCKCNGGLANILFCILCSFLWPLALLFQAIVRSCNFHNKFTLYWKFYSKLSCIRIFEAECIFFTLRNVEATPTANRWPELRLHVAACLCYATSGTNDSLHLTISATRENT